MNRLGAYGCFLCLSLLCLTATAFSQSITPQPATITSFSPTSGPVGTTVTVTGTNFNSMASNNIVYFGGVKATVVSGSSTTLTVTVPSGAAYSTISVTDTARGLSGFSRQPFLVTFTSSSSIDASSFNGKVDISSGANPYQLAIADYDRDSKPDIAVVNFGSSSISIYQNLSSSGAITTGSFASKVDIAAGSSPHSLVHSDLDGDGRIDLIICSRYGNVITVYRNVSTTGVINGGSFQPGVSFSTGAGPWRLSVGDLDNDGKPDVVASNNDASAITVLRNTSVPGTISFSPKQDFPLGAGNSHVAVRDIDGDGLPDLLAMSGTNNLSILRNTSTSGIISFAAYINLPVSGGPAGFTVEDLDADGKPDLIITRYNLNQLSIFKNVSTVGSIAASSFASPVDFLAGAEPGGVAVGDFNGDGKPDIVVADYGSNTLSIYKNQTSAGIINSSSFASRVIEATGSNPSSAAVSDIDGDGKSDIIVANNNSATISIFRNATSFTPSTNNGLIAYYPFNGNTNDASGNGNNGTANGAVLTADRFGNANGAYSFNGTNAYVQVPNQSYLNGNTVLTLCTWFKSSGTGNYRMLSKSAVGDYQYGLPYINQEVYVQAWTADGGDHLQSRALVTDGQWHFVTGIIRNNLSAQLYVDGVLVSSSTTPSSSWNLSGSGPLWIGAQPNASGILVAFFPGLIDDIRIYNRALSATEVDSLYHLGNWPPSVPTPTISSFTPTFGPVGTTVTITGTNFSSTASDNIVYFGAVRATVSAASTTSLTVAVPPSATYDPISVTVGNLIAYSTKPFNVTFSGSPVIDANSFAPRFNLSTGSNPTDIAVADLDGNGKPDLVVPNYSSGTISIYRNVSSMVTLSSSSFATKVDISTGTNPSSLALGDLDGDGKLDIVVTVESGRTVVVHRNTCTVGGISFSGSIGVSVTATANDVAVYDIDGDGKLDIIFPDLYNNKIKVLRNTSQGTTITFASSIDVVTGSGPYGIAVADVDGDGKGDLLVANSGPNTGTTMSAIRNISTMGNIAFSLKSDFTVGLNPQHIAAGDFDADGKLDVAVTSWNDQKVSLLRNTSTAGNISYAAKIDCATGGGAFPIKLGDIDGGGKVDILVANSQGNSFSVFRNTSSQANITFSAKQDFSTGTQPSSFAVADLDGDGRPEVLTSNYLDNTLSVFKNAGGSTASITPTGPVDASAGTPFWVEVKVGDPNAVSDLYGISLKLKSSQAVCTYVDGSAGAGTFLGTSPLTFFQKVDAQTVDMAITKTLSPGASGSGIVAKAQFMVSTSSSSPLSVVFSLLDISATSSSGATIQLAPGTLTIMISTGPVVWPGDCSNDGVVNSADLLPIGLFYGQTFGAANNPGTIWQAYPRTYWINEPPGKKVYADANGDGIINSADLLPIGLNYGKTHTVTTNSAVTGEMLAKADLAFEGRLDIASISYRSVSEGRLYVPVVLKSSRPVYGVSFRMKYALDGTSVARDAVIHFVEIDTAGTVLGGGLMISRPLDEGGMVDIAITKTAGMGFVGSGELVGIVMGVPANNTSMVRLEIYDIKAIDHDGKDVVIAGSVYRGEASSPTQEEHQQPAKFELMANYPNPFNPKTTVMFSLTEEAYVTLRVYDVLGREVVTLLDGERTGGVHAMQWDGKNSSGNQVESGVYYCRMSVRASSGQQFNQAQRMVFMK